MCEGFYSGVAGWERMVLNGKEDEVYWVVGRANIYSHLVCRDPKQDVTEYRQTMQEADRAVVQLDQRPNSVCIAVVKLHAG